MAASYIGFGQGRAWPLLTGERAHFELAAGNDVSPLINAIERFSSFGGMLPEQVWDYADMPSERLYCGRSAGSAQPLCWAHAEYLKLLRSVTDGHIFDRISVVEERYGVPKDQRTFESRMEIFRTTRPISAMVAGGTLRVIDPDVFQIIWTIDNWATTNKNDAKPVDSFGSFVDLAGPIEALRRSSSRCSGPDPIAGSAATTKSPSTRNSQPRCRPRASLKTDPERTNIV